MTSAILSSVSKSTLTFVQVFFGALWIAVCAQIEIPLIFTPVPLSFQTFALMLVTLVLGPRKGPTAVLLYLLEGACGLPVFAGGSSGILHFFGPTGGYLIGFWLQALLMGVFLQNSFSRIKLFFVLVLTSLVQLGLGSCWLGQFVGYERALWLGVLPFFPGDLLKILAVCGFYPVVRRFSYIYNDTRPFGL
jgi:biotin transport system substrate-specific component